MAEHKTLSSNSRSNHLFDAGLSNRVDLFLRSESPREQEIFLKQKLHEEIEKNSLGKVRYVDSELYLKNNRRSPSNLLASDHQADPAASDNKPAQSESAGKRNPEPEANSTTDDPQKRPQQQQHSQQMTSNDRNCQVCLIKEMRQDLMNINKVIQERNEQISKLKSKCLRSYFRRQLE